LLSESLPAALPALTSLQVSCRHADVSGLTTLRRLDVRGLVFDDHGCTAVEGLSELTALEDLRLGSEHVPFAQRSDLAPLTALTRLVAWCLPPELGSLPVAARLRRLELQAFGVLWAAPGGGDGSGANGAAAAALAALARGAPLLERLRIRVRLPNRGGPFLLAGYPPGGVALGAPLGPGVAWPSLTHLQVAPWAALLLADCAFPRLSRFAASVDEEGGGKGIAADAQLRTAVAALAAKARDHAALLVDSPQLDAPDGAGVLAAAAAVPGLSHLSWRCSWRDRAVTPHPGDWARLASSLESLELSGCLSTFGYAEPLTALTGLTHLSLAVDYSDAASEESPPLPSAGGACEVGEPPVGPVGGDLARAARALARLPRLTHLRVKALFGSDWGVPAVAAELARCPALRLLEIDGRDGRLWEHERDPPGGPRPHAPRPSPAWPPFAQALRAGGFSVAVRPVPEDYPPGDGIEM
jgi:hypothetical protein